jgi:hypothetical protein
MVNKFSIKERVIIVGITAIFLAIVAVILYMFHLIDDLIGTFIVSVLGAITYHILDVTIIEPLRLKRKTNVSPGGENVKFESSKVFQLNKLTKTKDN